MGEAWGRWIGGAAVVLVVLILGFAFWRSAGDDPANGVSDLTMGSESVAFAELPTESCRTETVVELEPVQVDPQLAVPVSADFEDLLTAYASSSGSILIGPADWNCRATMGADGSESIGLTPPDFKKEPWLAEPGDAVVLESIVPACAGCISSMICSFFPHEDVVRAYAESEDCPEIPKGERVSYVSRSTVTFVDPAGVAGTGVGSGGSLASAGAVVYRGREQGSRRLSCTLPEEIAELCGGIVGGTLALGG